ncbi:hypothetical protein FNF29_04792 [Cafeteria roenbergensis]|uniref:Uncharacterized protein n=1 Tax=Cafeteria roenbergensis TaxID=33653 RepID=A0A5A8CGY2_CAFRO|nr:hypothetical protein FNF29_04792 [Cafeteria roenbergensis]KAA0157364.1 hypothetical protein FNF28_06538 [Cafeteria roenbergensis]KAA0164851.1 hypothetical protein FNF31_02174 [Cafeteria roenbergensis]|eukprot:KAA0151101.1 hypothetical protein FNF29_04792 [Cafeteria roenbergensis]
MQGASFDDVQIRADFDAANCAGVERTGTDAFTIRPKADCEGGPNPTTYRTWFHFAVAVRLPPAAAAPPKASGSTFSAGRTLSFTIAPYNRQPGLFRAGHRPSVIGGSGTPRASRQWRRLRTPAVLSSDEGEGPDGKKEWRLGFSLTWPAFAAGDGRAVDGSDDLWSEYCHGGR